MKNGIPIRAVNTPIGVSYGSNNILAAISAYVKSVAPNKKAQGIFLL